MKRKVFITVCGILLIALAAFCLSSLATPEKTTLWQAIIKGLEGAGVKTDEIVWKDAAYYDDDGDDCRARADEQAFGQLVEVLKNIEVRRTLTKGEHDEFERLSLDGQYKGTLKEGVHKVYEVDVYVEKMKDGRLFVDIDGVGRRTLYFKSFTALPDFRDFFK